RNALALRGTRVRIPPSPLKHRDKNSGAFTYFILYLFSDNRLDEARLVLNDKNLREKLYREYKIK
ncbi:MAG: hypothetical protein ACI4SD_06320, partial [Suilimivivens sp.]